MKIYALADTHLSFASPKPMDMFGPDWEGHWEKLSAFWRAKVSSEDAVLIAGDISWAMTLQDALADLSAIGELPGKKILIRGNQRLLVGLYKPCARSGAGRDVFFAERCAEAGGGRNMREQGVAESQCGRFYGRGPQDIRPRAYPHGNEPDCREKS